MAPGRDTGLGLVDDLAAGRAGGHGVVRREVGGDRVGVAGVLAAAERGVEVVVAGADRVVARAGGEAVGAGAADQRVARGAGRERVVAVPAVERDRDRDRARAERVVTVAARE